MSQRLGIAAALLGDPATLMFDEPVNGLDPDGILWIRNLMKGLAAEGRTVFVSSHLMSEMENTADRLIVISRGRLIADCTVTEFIDANSTQKVRVLTPQRDLLAKVAVAAGGTICERLGRRPARPVRAQWHRRGPAARHSAGRLPARAGSADEHDETRRPGRERSCPAADRTRRGGY
jgi:ABC-type multidrug transport system ATPase subunit